MIELVLIPILGLAVALSIVLIVKRATKDLD